MLTKEQEHVLDNLIEQHIEKFKNGFAHEAGASEALLVRYIEDSMYSQTYRYRRKFDNGKVTEASEIRTRALKLAMENDLDGAEKLLNDLTYSLEVLMYVNKKRHNRKSPITLNALRELEIIKENEFMSIIQKADEWLRDKGFKRCAECNHLHLTGIKEIQLKNAYGTRKVCRKCLEEKYFKCEHCNTWSHQTDERPIDSRTNGTKYKSVCRWCYSDLSYVCYITGDRLFGNYNIIELNKKVSPKAFADAVRKKQVARCSDCPDQEYWRIEHLKWHDEDNVFRCSNHSSSSNIKRTVLKKCTPGKKLIHPIHAGIEIEVEYVGGGGKERAKDIFRNSLPFSSELYIQNDGSLSNGMEVCTPPRWGKELEDMLHAIQPALRDSGFAARKTCGLHVHLNAKGYSRRQIKKVTRLYALFEEYLYRMLPESRRTGSYSKPLAPQYTYESLGARGGLDELFYKTKDQLKMKSMKAQHRGMNRYLGLNIHSYFFRGTLEFRHHNGTIQASKMINWIRIIQNLMVAGKNITVEEMDRIKGMNNTDRKDAFYKLVLKDKDLIEYYEKRVNLFADHGIDPELEGIWEDF